MSEHLASSLALVGCSFSIFFFSHTTAQGKRSLYIYTQRSISLFLGITNPLSDEFEEGSFSGQNVFLYCSLAFVCQGGAHPGRSPY